MEIFIVIALLVGFVLGIWMEGTICSDRFEMKQFEIGEEIRELRKHFGLTSETEELMNNLEEYEKSRYKKLKKKPGTSY